MPLLPIQKHVLKYPVSIRIQFLAVFLANRQQLEQLVKEYPTQIVIGGYSAVIDSFSDFTFDGWVGAIWSSL